jgi:hypothetical protein
MHAIINTKEMIAKAVERHGILLQPDDPAFAIVTLNEMVLESKAAALIQQVDNSISEFSVAADRILVRAGAALAEKARTAIEFMRNGVRADLETGGYKARELVIEVYRVHSRLEARGA